MKSVTKTKDLVLIAMFAALIAVGAFIKIPLPLCPVTLQTLFTTLAGFLLGSRKGAAACAVYVIIGLTGIPVFTGGGGITYVLKPSFGYLIGFIAGTYITGKIVCSGPLTMKRLLIGGFAGILVIYAFGLPYCFAACNLWVGNPVGIWPLIVTGFLTPVPSDIIACIVASVIAKRLIPIVNRDNQIQRAV